MAEANRQNLLLIIDELLESSSDSGDEDSSDSDDERMEEAINLLYAKTERPKVSDYTGKVNEYSDEEV